MVLVILAPAPQRQLKAGLGQGSARLPACEGKERGEEFAARIRTKDNAWIRIQKMQKKVE